MTKTYIISPNFTTRPPPSGLRLGHILTNPFDSELSPLNRKCHVSILHNELFSPDVKEGFTASRSDLMSTHLSIWARFLSTFRLGVDVSRAIRSDDMIRIEKLETQAFDPSIEYVKESISTPRVRSYIEESGERVTLYMVTGIKVARGVSMFVIRSKKSTAAAHVETIPQTGADIGGNGGFERDITELFSFEKSTDFVLAFRVRKIKVHNQKVKIKTFTKGATMSEAGGGVPNEGTCAEELKPEMEDDLTAEDLISLMGNEYEAIIDTKDGSLWVK
ncbi:hypothetical protein OQA88_10916 [Cercophora sp. LCS_1]